jgi:hypothetical protein
LTKITTTLPRVFTVLNDAATAGAKDVLGFAVFEVHNLFDEIKTKALRCKVESLTSFQVLKNLSSPFKWFNRGC